MVAKTIALDPYTLITGEDVSVDLSSTDLSIYSDLDLVAFASTTSQVSFEEFGTATLIFISGPNSDLINILVEPTLDQFDWLHWIPLPRLILSESYFHIFGLDYPQAFALFHLIPIWIYYLLHCTLLLVWSNALEPSVDSGIQLLLHLNSKVLSGYTQWILQGIDC